MKLIVTGVILIGMVFTPTIVEAEEGNNSGGVDQKVEDVYTREAFKNKVNEMSYDSLVEMSEIFDSEYTLTEDQKEMNKIVGEQIGRLEGQKANKETWRSAGYFVGISATAIIGSIAVGSVVLSEREIKAGEKDRNRK